MWNGWMMLVAFAIYQIIVLYVLMFAENWDYFVLDCWRVWLVCMFAENHRDYYVWLVMYVYWKLRLFLWELRLLYSYLLSCWPFFVIVKPDRYPISTQNLTGTSMGMNFYPWIWVQVWISTHGFFVGGRVIVLPDLNLTHCHPNGRSVILLYHQPFSVMSSAILLH
jgi:hypothetical protein